MGSRAQKRRSLGAVAGLRNNAPMRKLVPWIVVVLTVIVSQAYLRERDARTPVTGPATGGGRLAGSNADSELARAFRERRSNFQVTGAGTVVRLLADDNDGDRHQRFVLELESGQTLLVAHNIDLAPRIPNLVSGDRVSFFGEYEWNEQGGVIHWTHDDPAGRHVAGWLEHDGTRYQ
jgi:hypothetical protein